MRGAGDTSGMYEYSRVVFPFKMAEIFLLAATYLTQAVAGTHPEVFRASEYAPIFTPALQLQTQLSGSGSAA